LANAQTSPQVAASVSQPPVLLDASDTTSNASAKQYLLNKIRTNGSARLIVRLRVATQPENLLSQTQLQTQRNAIVNAQNDLVGRLGQLNSVAYKRFVTLPFVVVQANESAFNHLLASSDVVSVQEDAIMQTSLAQSVPLIGGDKAWAAGATGAGQTVAIVDTGVDSSHPFLAGKVIAEACYSSNANGVKSICPDGSTSQTGAGAARNCALSACDHGTHVAGIAAGKGKSYSGVAKDARIIAVQVFTLFPDSNGNFNSIGAYSSDIMSGLEYVYSLRNTYKIAAVNLSLGGGSYNQNCDGDAIKPAVDNLRSAGIVTVVAAGNGGLTDSLSAPACISTVVSVGATTKSDVVDSYSNSASFLTMLAPGTSINSSVPGGGYAQYTGTSMAAPHVTGAWAVYKSKMPNASITDVLNAMLATGKKITDSRNNIVKPRIQIDAALIYNMCFNASNPTHVNAGRAHAVYGYAYANGSNKFMGLNYSFYTSKLRNTGLNYYIVDNTCP
jgi:subtilisin family serine protease